MRTLVISILVIGILMYGVVKLAFPTYDKVAGERVATILNGMKEGGDATKKTESAMSMWAYGMLRVSDRDRLSWASDNFDRWRNEKKLYRATGDYKIDKVEMVPDTAEETAIVTFTLEGKEYKVRVPKDHAISWVN